MEKEAETPTKRGKSGLLVVLLAVVNLLGLAGLGYFVVSTDRVGAAGGGGGGASDAGVSEAKGPSFGPLVEMRPIVANLSDPDAGRYIKVSLRIEAKNEQAEKQINESLVPLRDQALFYFSGIGVQQTVGVENKVAMREELENKLAGVVGEGVIKRIYFTEFVVQ
ncbi:MAG: flagellar basal body-associated FliL family protein [Myxococcales bacterium]|nr:flagellar basal body-associated FliL family protein [Myxococcales bacterium]